MKTTEIRLQADISNTGETQKNTKTSKGLKYLLFLFMLSSISFLPSCAVELRTPQPGVSIENHHRHRHHRIYRHSRNEHVDVEIHNR
jgi:hypothetical protein